jgi:tRNA (guanosine-2'-O-)-methyltransferase
MTERRRQKMLSVLGRKQPGLTLVLENIHDPHNVSAIFRSADAVGLVDVQLVYTQDTFPRLGKKSSASAKKWIRRRNFSSVRECYSTLRSEGFRIVATRLGKRSESLYNLDLTGRVALVFGNEHRGVSDEAAELADGNFLIPMNGMIESLNVSVACAVTLYEAFRQRNARGMYDTPGLSPAEIRSLLDEWTER